MTPQPVAEAFKTMVGFQPPFQIPRVGFRDVVIFLSVVDNLLARPQHAGFLVTDDKGFNELLSANQKVSLGSRGVLLELRGIDDLRQYLEGLQQQRESDKERARREQEEARARRALGAKRAELEMFIQNNLQYQMGALGLYQPQVIGIEVGEIERVAISNLSGASPDETKILAEVRVRILKLALPGTMTPPTGWEGMWANVSWTALPVSVGSSGAERWSRAAVEAVVHRQGEEYEITAFISAVVLNRHISEG
jgi:hypothetical protein